MNTKEELLEKIITCNTNSILLELPTGIGKSKLSIERLNNVLEPYNSLLIVVSRLVHKQMWKIELSKWLKKDLDLNISFTTYNSLKKHIGYYDAIIIDECQHLTETAQAFLRLYTTKYMIFLSATVPHKIKENLIKSYKVTIYKESLRNIIDTNNLPDPRVILIPLHLNIMQENTYNLICKEIDRYKRLYNSTGKSFYKNFWLKTCGDRLLWLSNQKTDKIKYLLNHFLIEYRVITFCNSIEQTEQLGDKYIHSKNKVALNTLNAFNRGDINHITCCNMLNEGVNLVNCQVAVYAILHNSDIVIKQQLGRILRHSNPIVYLPYYVNTREEEIKNKMLLDYNKDLISEWEEMRIY